MVVSDANLVLYVEEQFNPSPRLPLWGSPIFDFLFLNIYYIILLIVFSVVMEHFLALHVRFRYLVSSLALWDCLYPNPIILFGLFTDVKIMSQLGGLCGFCLERLIFFFCQGVEFGTQLFIAWKSLAFRNSFCFGWLI